MTAGSSRARCRSPRCTTRSRTRDWFDSHYPGDFIVEYIGQTRGWFYTLHVLATALFDRPAFRTCVSHGIVLGNDGRKMSKSLRNYPDVNEVFDTYGSDAMRWFLMASRRSCAAATWSSPSRASARASGRRCCRCGTRTTSSRCTRTRRTTRRGPAPTAPHVLDRYILGQDQGRWSRRSGSSSTRYDVAGACQTLRDYLELLTNWYIRRSRSRFWEGDPDALDTLWTVLETVTRAAAPLLPMTAETIWRGLTGGASVHLEDWPAVAGWPSDDALADDHGPDEERVQRRAEPPQGPPAAGPAAARVADGGARGRAARSASSRTSSRTRSTSRTWCCSADPATLGEFQLTVNPRVLGPRLGKQVQEVIRAVKAGAVDPGGRRRYGGRRRRCSPASTS